MRLCDFPNWGVAEFVYAMKRHERKMLQFSCYIQWKFSILIANFAVIFIVTNLISICKLTGFKPEIKPISFPLLAIHNI